VDWERRQRVQPLANSTTKSTLGDPEDAAVDDDDDSERQPERPERREDGVGIVLTDVTDACVRVILFT